MAPSKLSEDDKRNIVSLYRDTDETTAGLAKRYGVSVSTITRLVKSQLSSDEYDELVRQKRVSSPRGSLDSDEQPPLLALEHSPQSSSPQSPSPQTAPPAPILSSLGFQPPSVPVGGTGEPLPVPQPAGKSIAPDLDPTAESESSGRRKRRRSSGSNSPSADPEPIAEPIAEPIPAPRVADPLRIAPPAPVAPSLDPGMTAAPRFVPVITAARSIYTPSPEDTPSPSPDPGRLPDAARSVSRWPKVNKLQDREAEELPPEEPQSYGLPSGDRPGRSRSRSRSSFMEVDDRAAPQMASPQMASPQISSPQMASPMVPSAPSPEVEDEPLDPVYAPFPDDETEDFGESEDFDETEDFDESEDFDEGDDDLGEDRGDDTGVPSLFSGLNLSRNQVVQVLPLASAHLPETGYFVVDRMAELVTCPLHTFQELGYIPPEEANRRTLPLFDNHRVARRFSKHTQKVIKLPNPQMLHKTLPCLEAKGITRLLVDGQVYSLEA
jgi:transposase-like protein